MNKKTGVWSKKSDKGLMIAPLWSDPFYCFRKAMRQEKHAEKEIKRVMKEIKRVRPL